MKYFFAIAIWIVTDSIAHGQVSKPIANRVIVGKVFDEKENPIPFASVGLLHHQIGTSSNQAGDFLVSFKLDSLIKYDTLVISVIGYKSFRQAMSMINDTLVVRLENHTYELDEVIITNLSASEVVVEMFKSKRKNYPRKKYKVEAFFRGLIRNDSTYVMMTEAVLNIADKGYHKYDDTNFYLSQLKYIDQRDLDSLDIYYNNFAESNEVNRLWSLDYMNNYFEKIVFYPSMNINYELDSISYFDNHLVYCISVKVSPWYYNQVFIRMDNFVLIEARRGMYLENLNQKSTDKTVGSIGSGVDDKHSRVELVQYKPYKGKWYLSYVSLSSSIIGGDKQKVKRLANEEARRTGATELKYKGIEYDGRVLDSDKNNYFRHDELFITYIFDKSEKMPKGQIMERNKYVHYYNVSYDNEFWRDYKQLLLNPNLKRAKSHLKEAEILNTVKN